MSRPTRQRTIELLDTVYDLLKNKTSTIHYKPLADVLVKTGLWAEPWGDDHAKTLYNAIFSHFRAHGKSGLFLLFAGGYICTTNIPGAEFYDEETAMKSKKRIRSEKPVPAPLEKRCGNCQFMEWRGPNIVTHDVGTCTKYQLTGRPRVYLHTESCTEWKPKSTYKLNVERHERASLGVK